MTNSTLRQLAQEIVDDLLLLLSAVLIFSELIIVDHTPEDFLLFNVKIVLRLIEGSLKLPALLHGSLLDSLSLLKSLLPLL